MKEPNENTNQNDPVAGSTTPVIEPPANAEDPGLQNAPDTASLDRLQAENDQLRTAIRLLDARDHLTAALRTAGARSPGLLFEAAKDMLQFDDDGRLQNMADVARSMQEKFPEQFGGDPAPSIDGGAGTLASTKVLSVEGLSKMTPAQIQKLDWDDVRRVISER